ncbi:17747_t:CDS:2 [Entrophospora sp. SA101]|nr:17747_t:CDS:2 [Entrophospora sp. SA101]
MIFKLERPHAFLCIYTKWALESQVANKEKDAIDNYILGTKHS